MDFVACVSWALCLVRAWCVLHTLCLVAGRVQEMHGVHESEQYWIEILFQVMDAEIAVRETTDIAHWLLIFPITACRIHLCMRKSM